MPLSTLTDLAIAQHHEIARLGADRSAIRIGVQSQIAITKLVHTSVLDRTQRHGSELSQETGRSGCAQVAPRLNFGRQSSVADNLSARITAFIAALPQTVHRPTKPRRLEVREVRLDRVVRDLGVVLPRYVNGFPRAFWTVYVVPQFRDRPVAVVCPRLFESTEGRRSDVASQAHAIYLDIGNRLRAEITECAIDGRANWTMLPSFKPLPEQGFSVTIQVIAVGVVEQLVDLEIRQRPACVGSDGDEPSRGIN